MYSRSTGRIRRVSDDLMEVDVEIRRTWRNINYVGSIFGGSMLSATDPILMVQLINILGDDYVVWDESVDFRFRRPARSTLRVRFAYTPEELETIRERVEDEREFDLEKTFELVDASGETVASGTKTLYVAANEHYKAKRRAKKALAA